jgi:cytoskeletal protein CcmA (bactofilin family)
MAAKLILDNGKTWKVKVEESVLAGEVDIKIVNEERVEWYLFQLKQDGTFARYENIEADSGIKVSRSGKIKQSDAPTT